MEHPDSGTKIETSLGVLTFKQRLSDDALARIKDQLREKFEKKEFPIIVEGEAEWRSFGLVLTEEQKQKLADFHDSGLVWLVNAAVLHPRGWALTIHLDDQRNPTGLSIQGDGIEPWCFAPGEQGEILKNFETAEMNREREITPALEARLDSH